MNVSFTRARSKLVIFGSRSTLQGDPLLAQFFELMDGQGWVYGLLKDAHLFHDADLREEMEDIKEEDSDQEAKTEEMEPAKIEEQDVKMEAEETVKQSEVKAKEESVKMEHAEDEVEIVASSDDIIVVDTKPRKTSPLKRPANVLDECIEIHSEDEEATLARHGFSSGKMEVDHDEVLIVSTGPVKILPNKLNGKGKEKEKENRDLASTSTSSTFTVKPKPPTAQTKSKPPAKPAKAKAPTASSSSSVVPRNNQSKLDGWFKTGTVKKPEAPEDTEGRPKKMQKVGKGSAASSSCASSFKKANGLLKGRPILNDLVKNEA
jgi:hypothetical protein